MNYILIVGKNGRKDRVIMSKEKEKLIQRIVKVSGKDYEAVVEELEREGYIEDGYEILECDEIIS